MLWDYLHTLETCGKNVKHAVYNNLQCTWSYSWFWPYFSTSVWKIALLLSKQGGHFTPNILKHILYELVFDKQRLVTYFNPHFSLVTVLSFFWPWSLSVTVRRTAILPPTWLPVKQKASLSTMCTVEVWACRTGTQPSPLTFCSVSGWIQTAPSWACLARNNRNRVKPSHMVSSHRQQCCLWIYEERYETYSGTMFALKPITYTDLIMYLDMSLKFLSFLIETQTSEPPQKAIVLFAHWL